ncbi:hypothetical protein M8494_17830 [Serratia ureilytica]
MMQFPERGFYSRWRNTPLRTFSASVATITGLLFYVTRRTRPAGAGQLHPRLADINNDAPTWQDFRGP